MSQTKTYASSKTKRSKAHGGGSARGVPTPGQPGVSQPISISLQLSSSISLGTDRPDESVPNAATTTTQDVAQFREQQELARLLDRDAKLDLFMNEFSQQKSTLLQVQATLAAEQIKFKDVTALLLEKDRIHTTELADHKKELADHKNETAANFAIKDKRINMLIEQIKVLNECNNISSEHDDEVNEWFMTLCDVCSLIFLTTLCS